LLASVSVALAQAPSDKPAATTAPAAAPKAAKGAAAGDAAATNPKSQASYSIGVAMGTQLHQMGLNGESLSTERVTQGLRDALSGKAAMSAEHQKTIQAFIETAHNKLADTNHAAAQAFLAENGKKKDIITTASGLQYHVINAGTGASPKPTDTVTVNYRGSLLDGTEFDSSYKRGQPAQFPVNGVIPGWTEALLLMKPGSKFELFVPPKLAYDLRPPTPVIPPGSLLKFEVELIGIKPPEAAAAPKIAPGMPVTPPPAPK
jgi:FKBP-type peptidyl-prolyl cis-trans isomerase FklB